MLPLQRRARSRDSTEAVRAHPTVATFFSAYPEAAQRVRTESRTDRDVIRIATAGNQRPANTRDVVARVKGVSFGAEIAFEPG
jgi:hypothetical protein